MINARTQPPVSTAVIPQIIDAVENPNATHATVARVVETDAGLTARVLGLANSAQFGLSRHVDRVDLAVGLVGQEIVRVLAIGGATPLLNGNCGLPEAREHALGTAAAARRLAPKLGVHPSDAFAAGLLHDLGELLLWQQRPGDYATLAACDLDPADQLRVELEMFGIDHAELGAEHLFSWRVPDRLVDAVGDHHDPQGDVSSLTVIVAAADELVTSEESSMTLSMLGVNDETADELRSSIDAEIGELTEVLVSR